MTDNQKVLGLLFMAVAFGLIAIFCAGCVLWFSFEPWIGYNVLTLDWLTRIPIVVLAALLAILSTIISRELMIELFTETRD